MCLVVFAWNATPGQRLVLVGNRDEFHSRATAPMAWWDSPALLAGRDLVAGGTWLGLDGRGRFGVITNFRGREAPPDPPSRGTLIPRYLGGSLAPHAFLEELAGEAHRYAGFSLLVGDQHELCYFGNRDHSAPRSLPAGVYGLSNAALDVPWPKLSAGRAALARHLASAPPVATQLLDLLQDPSPAADPQLPDTGVGLELERRLSAAFIRGADYGTRATTAVVLASDGRGAIAERSHGPGGESLGLRRYTIGDPPP